MDFYEEENRDAVRFSWNALPTSKLEALRITVPLAVHYTPLANIELACLEYAPHTCKCEAVLNKFTQVNFGNKTFLCQFCGVQQQLPPGYSNQISPQMLPYEMTKECSTFECRLIQKVVPPAYLFVVDLCMITEEEFVAVKEEIAKAIEKLPDTALVGLITFNKFVHVHELTAKINTVYCVSGSKDYTNVQVLDVLGLQIKNDPRGVCHDIAKKFLVPIGNNREKITKRIKDVKIDQLIYVNERPLRATSAALNIAITLAESSPVVPRIITFIGGPCTIGTGKIIEQSFEKMMRTQNDIYKGENCENYNRASKYYDLLTKRLVAKKIVLDIFGFCLDQFGLLQMKKLVESGGGLLVMQEEFKNNIFRDSFQKLFVAGEDNQFRIDDEAHITILTTKQIAINGILGHCLSLKRKGGNISETEIGEGGTCSWHLGGIDPLKTLTVLLEINSKEKIAARNFMIQFKTVYRRGNSTRMRVTTLRREFAQDINMLAVGFDQEAATVALGRLAAYKSMVEEHPNIGQWLDKSLFKFTSHFANFTRNDVQSFSLPPQMKSFPQFIYHLRRTNLINPFGTNPDECYYYRFYLMRETVQNCISMVQPALLQYTLEKLEPTPVMLDEESMQDEVVLLLDSYFVVALWYGANIRSWEQGGYHEMEGYEHVKELMNAPNEDIDYIVSSRFPTPLFYRTYPGHPKERYLKSKVNPKKSGEQNENLITDDANIKAFTEYLVRLVVTQPLN